jgi:hypothetical protein
MNQITFQEVERLISEHQDIVFFGSEEDYVGDEWVRRAEDRLGLEFTTSYKWFLRKYAGGEIGTEEVFSVYGSDFEKVNGGDIVFQHIADLNNLLASNKMLVISQTDFGELFFFDYSQFKDGECPIKLRIPSGNIVDYAANFFEFLYNRISAYK